MAVYFPKIIMIPTYASYGYWWIQRSFLGGSHRSGVPSKTSKIWPKLTFLM